MRTKAKKKLHGLSQKIKQTLKTVGVQYKRHLEFLDKKREETFGRKVWEGILQTERNQYVKEQKILEDALSLVPDNIKCMIHDEIEESGYTHGYELIETKDGKCPISDLLYQNDSGLDIWVDQYKNGGYTGDEFAGKCYIRLTDTKFLLYHYSM